MTNQEIFDKVAAHLLKQNARAENPDGGACFYRSPEGLTCAVGCLIPAEVYDSKIEGASVCLATTDSLKPQVQRLREVLGEIGILQDQFGLLAILQKIHDLEEISEWKCNLIELAQEYNLAPDIVES